MTSCPWCGQPTTPPDTIGACEQCGAIVATVGDQLLKPTDDQVWTALDDRVIAAQVAAVRQAIEQRDRDFRKRRR